MGFFKFHNLNPICRTYLSRFHSQTNKNFHLHPHTLTIQALGSSQFYERHPFTPSDSPNFKISKRWHVGHSHNHRDQSGKEAENIFRLGLAADIGLAAGKALTGYLSGSTAIIADAAHSVSDVVLSGVALLSFKAARIPKDKEHPYGHGKFETLGALGISVMLLGTAGGIAWHALDILVALLDNKDSGEKEGSGLMKANAWHHRADAVSSFVALIGVGGSILGMKFLDPLAGIVVSGMILKAGLDTGYQSILELVDAAVPSQQLDLYKQSILQVEGVKGCNHLRGRRAGSSVHLDVNIEVDPFSSVSAAHDVGENVRDRIQKLHPEVAEVFIHIDPAISLLSETRTDQQWDMTKTNSQSRNLSSDQKHIEDIVSHIFSSKFSERLVLERITRHLLGDNIVLQIEVSMTPDMLIRDAIKVAEEAQREILEAGSHAVKVCILLRLGHTIPQLQ